MSVARISPAEALERVREQGYAYLDVRTVEEFALGHPEGAYNIPLRHMAAGGMQPNPRFLEEVKARFAPDAKLVVGCASGVRSLQAAEQLLAEGYPEVVEQRAGYSGVTDPFGRVTEPGWQALGLPCATTAQPGRSYAELKF